ncbi:MAG: hypothetical protein Q8Q13_00880 [bacterium]|nr:hypothetical protein [bacterium]
MNPVRGYGRQAIYMERLCRKSVRSIISNKSGTGSVASCLPAKARAGQMIWK